MTASFFLVLLLLPLILVLWQIALFYWSYSRASGIPDGPRPWPIVGNALELLGHSVGPVEWLNEKAKTYGDVFAYWWGNHLHIHVRSHEIARELLITKDKDFASRPYVPGTLSLAFHERGVTMAPDNEHWRKSRKLMALHVTSAKAMREHAVERTHEIDALVGHMRSAAVEKQAAVQFRDHLVRMGINATAMPAMSLRFAFPSEPTFNKETEAQFRLMLVTFERVDDAELATVVPLLEPLLNWKAKALARSLDGCLEAIVARHVQVKTELGSAFSPRDFVDHVIEATAAGDFEKGDCVKLLKDQLHAALAIGVSTEWTLAEIARDPRIQSKLYNELVSTTGPDGPVTEADLEKLRYLKAVVKEHFRHRSSTDFLQYHTNEKEATLAGYRLPPRTQVSVYTRAFAQDSSVFADGQRFNPDRFLDEDVHVSNLGTDLRFLAFGAGRRNCIGHNLSVTVVLLAVANLVKAFRLQPATNGDIDMTSEWWAYQDAMATPLTLQLVPRRAS